MDNIDFNNVNDKYSNYSKVNGTMSRQIKNYYLRINDGKMKKIDRYEEVELVEGTNKIELSKDGVNILKRIVVERDK